MNKNKIEKDDYQLTSEKNNMFRALGAVLKNIALYPARLFLFVMRLVSNRFKSSLSIKINLYYALLTFIGMVSLTAILVVTYRNSYITNETSQLYLAAEQLARQYEMGERPIDDFLGLNSGDTLVFKVNYDAILTKVRQSTKTEYETNPFIFNGPRTLYSSAAVSVGNRIYKITLTKDITVDYKRFFKQIIYAISIMGGIFIIIVYLGDRLTRMLLNPIDQMTKDIGEITVDSLDIRLDEKNTEDELKALTRQINIMMSTIEDAYKKQHQFVSDASHELRTPLSVINGYTDMLNRWGKKDPAILEEAITEIKAETKQMQGLIEKLLFLARGDQGRLDIVFDSLNLTELVKNLCKDTNIMQSGHTIICEAEDEVYMLGNEQMIIQMLRVFLENAIKFTPEGGIITIGATLIGSKPLVYVRDTGVGIPREDLPKIFDRFYKADKSRQHRMQGSGLGLSIAKWIIDKHDGIVKVHSKIDEGTLIEVYF